MWHKVLVPVLAALAVAVHTTPIDTASLPEQYPDVDLEFGRTYTVDELHALQKEALDASKTPVASDKKIPTSLDKRQTSVHKTLNMKWQYKCTNEAAATTEFEWVAYFFPNTNKLTMQSAKNIDGFKNLVFNRPDFSTVWYHSVCKLSGNQVCTYNFQAHTTGSAYTGFVYMQAELPNNSNAINAPTVTKNCIHLSGNPVCPSVGSETCANLSFLVTSPRG